MPTKKHLILKTSLGLFVVIVIAASLWYWRYANSDDTQQKYRTEIVDRGDIVQAISANGTLNPVVLVNVGTQISGTIQKLHADFNDRVNAGQVLAELDPSLLNAQLKQDRATLEVAQANLKLAEAEEIRTRALVEKKFLSAQELDKVINTAEAARAQVKLVKAQLERAHANYGYSVIRSPVSGVVVARNVDLGQTVAASFQTPTLFQIAQDLKSMQIDTTVAEADIGNIRLGQAVTFTVDAFQNQSFKGIVKQIRLNPIILQNVVSYNVVVSAENLDGKLMPGMTAHVFVVANQRNAALRVPNSALRFKPEQDADTEQKKPQSTQVYLVQDGEPKAVAVNTGISDGNYTEITGGDLREGDRVITRSSTQTKAQNASGFRLRMF
jgi:HlyD family secretion protein